MEMKHLIFFCKVAELEHVTQAADELMVSQPFLTKIINQLEEELGVELFDHIGRKICLNQYGEVYYRRIKNLLHSLEDAQLEINEMSQNEEKTISVLTNVSLYMPQLLSSFQKEYPDTTIFQSSKERRTIKHSLREGNVDFALCCPPIKEHDHIKTQIIWREEVYLICPPDHPFKKLGAIKLADLKDENYICPPIGYGMRHTDIYFKQMGFYPKQVIESADTSSIPRYVKAGLGVAFIPKFFVESDPILKQDCVEILDCEISGYIGLSWNENRFQKKTAKQFKDFIIKEFSRL